MSDQFILQNTKCKVTIKEIQYRDLKAGSYRQILNPSNYTNSELTKAFSIHINLYDQDVMLATIGSHLSDIEDCAVLNSQALIIMMNEQFFKINVLDGTLIDYKALDVFGSNFAIFKIDNGYVVHGEVDILFLNENFEIISSFSGRDIFVSISGKKAFTLTKNTVQLYDFEDHYYEIDFEGKIVNEHAAN